MSVSNIAPPLPDNLCDRAAPAGSGVGLSAPDSLFALGLEVAQGVDRRHVHKAAIAEVLLTDARELAHGRAAVAAQWPRRHHRFDMEPHSPGFTLLLIETIRQAGIYVAHRHFDVPIGDQFAFNGITLHRPADPLLDVVSAPPTVLLWCTTRPTFRGQRLSQAELVVEMWCDRRLLATASARYTCLPPPVYSRLRAVASPKRPGGADIHADSRKVPPQRSGDDIRTTPLVVDRQDPTFFDHEVDHLPGMLMIDAALQAAAAHIGHRDLGVGYFTLDFARFAELDIPATVHTRLPAPLGRHTTVDVAIRQACNIVASGRIGYQAAG